MEFNKPDINPEAGPFQNGAPAAAAEPSPDAEAPPPPPEWMTDTLHERVWTSVWRDLKLIFLRTAQVLWVFQKVSKNPEVYENYDLFGPILYALLLGLFSSLAAGANGGQVFGIIFIIIFIVAFFVSSNIILLGGSVNQLGTVALLGYSTAPLVISSLAIFITHAAAPTNAIANGIVMAVFVGVCTAWSIYAGYSFLRNVSPPNKKFLTFYPIMFYYVALAFATIVFIRVPGHLPPAPNPPNPPNPPAPPRNFTSPFFRRHL